MEKAGMHAVILAGGQSRRMGTRKERLNWEGQPLLLHLADTVRMASLPCAVNIDRRQTDLTDALRARGVLTFPDLMESHGPMSGICSAMRMLNAPLLLFLSCDMPFVTVAAIRQLLACDVDWEEWDALVPWVEGRLHPLFAVYHRRTHQVWEDSLQRGVYRLQSVLARLRVNRIDTLDSRSLFNMNTPADYAQALAEQKKESQIRQRAGSSRIWFGNSGENRLQ